MLNFFLIVGERGVCIHGRFRICVTKILPVVFVQSILLFCIYMSDCIGLVSLIKFFRLGMVIAKYPSMYLFGSLIF